jgi:hypothetical protein
VYCGTASGPGEAPPLWALGDRQLVAARPEGLAPFDVSFLPPEGERHLEDLDGDGVPEVSHVEWDTQGATLAVFQPRVPSGGDLRPPAAVLRLPGYLIQHDFTDVNADGRLDFVVTTVPVDARNTIRALTGRVTAHTKAFLARPPGERIYPAVPDATVSSDVVIRIRFSAAGRIEIHRFFTIVPTGDLDGDGTLDLAIRTAPAELTIRRGTKDGVWERAGRTLSIPEPGETDEIDAWPADLDRSTQGDELLLVYRGVHGAPDRAYVLPIGP